MAATRPTIDRIPTLHDRPEPWPHTVQAVERAVVKTVAYADLFDFPLRLDEAHRYLIGAAVPFAAIRRAVAGAQAPSPYIRYRDGYLTLPGREELVEIRAERAEISRRLWREAVLYGRWIASIPFVRMIAVTGGLAVDNADAEADIDYLIITEVGYLWLCRAFVIALVRYAARRGIVICPNYFLSESALLIQERNLFTARELAQMVPLFGLDTYYRMRELNAWTTEYLPNAGGSPRRMPDLAPHLAAGAFAEHLLRTPLGNRIERWEMERKLRKFGARSTEHAEARFSVDWCKGHFDGHGQRILLAFGERMRALGIEGS